ncbi:MAG TPA: TonB-dependent receptor [Candidatus Acidoferrales bacterium]|nr:TonB-dependent receptor [Candidatus Acidoferrales bacterium]
MQRVLSWFVALSFFLCAVGQGTIALAGTTGNLSGVVLEADTGAPVAKATVTVSSPSQTASTTTDGQGRFTILSLAPDSYTVTVEKQGYDSTSVSGIEVYADQTQQLGLKARKTLQEIGHTTARANGELVRPGTTADIYSVNETVSGLSQALGGGGSMNQAFSGIATVPGVVVPAGESGWNQDVFIRGSNDDQTAYEFDGVPVNRAFDNYPGNTTSTLGQQELQVYTGGGPASTTSTGLGGMINQVIRTGTFPGEADVNFTLGSPTYDHTLNLQVLGATPNRHFTYYAGFLGSDQDFRYGDQYDDVSNPYLESPLITPPLPGVAPACVGGASGYGSVTPGYLNNAPLYADPGCYGFGPLTEFEGFDSHVTDREALGNFHFEIPHHHDVGNDDIQLLYTNSTLFTYFPDSPDNLNSLGILSNVYGDTLPVAYPTGTTFPAGTTFGESATGLAAVPYSYPGSDYQTNIPVLRDDGFTNDSSIVKLQYQKNFSSDAYFRIYGYTMYSDWLNNAPMEAAVGALVNSVPDYELSTHTKGFAAQFADQINPQNLIQLTANYTGAATTRWNNATIFNTADSPATNLVAMVGGQPVCYDAAGMAATCNPLASDPTYGTFGNPTPYAVTGTAAANGAKWIVTDPGNDGYLNTVVPQFTSYSLTDDWRPSEKWDVNAGVRLESFGYDLSSSNTPGENFWAAAIRNEACYNYTTLIFDQYALSCPSYDAHPDGVPITATNPKTGQTYTYTPIYYTNSYPLIYDPTELEPRLGATFTINPNTVIRASYGRYATPPDTASIQYLTAQPNSPGTFFQDFVAAGLASSPLHEIMPATANNYDVSLEKHLKGTDISFKVTPFFKLTQNALEDVYLDQVEQFVSDINAGTQKTDGVELEITKGDFNRNGFAAQLSYTYTDSKIRYNNVGSSSVNPIDQINDAISYYNAFTTSAPCYTPATASGPGTPLTAAQCASTPTAIQNPYYGQKAQPLLDRNGWYAPYALSPAVFGADSATYSYPHNLTLLMNYKKDRWNISPSFQVQAGEQYGEPLQTLGWDPTTCAQNQQTSNPALAGTPHAQWADWTSCGVSSGLYGPSGTLAGGTLVVPDYETGVFDAQGAFSEPTQLLGNLKISYDMSNNTKLTLLMANLINTCFGGSKEPWTVGGTGACGYGIDDYVPTSGISDFYNGTSPNDVAANGTSPLPYNLHAYQEEGVTQPFELFLTLSTKL